MEDSQVDVTESVSVDATAKGQKDSPLLGARPLHTPPHSPV